MRHYIATKIVDIKAGLVSLDDDQARRRSHNLKLVSEGIYSVEKPIMFKVGEEFGTDIEVNKRLASSLDEPTDESPDVTSSDNVVDISNATVDELKAHCDEQGIKYHAKAGVKKLTELLENGD